MADIMSQIILTGICLFLRPEAGKPPEAAVFMDGRTNLDETASAHPHHVYLVIDQSAYTVNQTKYTDEGLLIPAVKAGAFGKKFDVYTLDDRLIRIGSPATQGELTDDLDNAKFPIPHLKKAWPRIMGGGHKEIEGLHLSKRPDALKNLVNARFELLSGDLNVSFANDDQWQFAPGVLFHTRLEGEIPQEVTLKQTLVDDGVNFLIYDFSKAKLTHALKVKPKSGNTVTVLLANVPENDIFPSDSCVTEVDCLKDPENICCKDHHFSIYYKAFENQPGDPPLPHKLPNALALGLPHDGSAPLFRVGGANCGPAQQP